MAADPDTRARTHLANERTFLAWFRTGITLVALGLAGAQLLGGESDQERSVVVLLATLVIVTGTSPRPGGVRAVPRRTPAHRRGGLPAGAELDRRRGRPGRPRLPVVAVALVWLLQAGP